MTTLKDAKVDVLEVLHPVAATAKKVVHPAPRLRDLSGRKIGLYWNTKPGGDVGLEEAAKLLGDRFPNLKVEKFYYRFPTSEATRAKVVESGCEAIISAAAD